MRSKYLIILVACFTISPAFNANAQSLWIKSSADETVAFEKLKRNSFPNTFQVFKLDLDQLKTLLTGAPVRGSYTGTSSTIVSFPNSEGILEQYRVMESPIMHPDLAAKFPMIETYVAQGIEDPTAYMRFSITQFGLHTMTLSGLRSTTYIDTYTKDREYYIVYDRKSIGKDPEEFKCFTQEGVKLPSLSNNTAGTSQKKASNDQVFRTFRLALSCTAEYGNLFANTGTEVADIQAQMAISVNRVNSVYEVDLAVTLQFVSNNDLIIYWGSTTTDPWDGEWNTTTQNEIDSKIGDANYDIGHNFNTQGGGNAGCISCVCTSGSKGSAYTGRANPTGDAFDIDYVAHEMGHQLGGYHTMNTCSRSGNGATEVEPASGSSIMGYAGICGTNVQSNSDAHLNYVNIRDISANIQSGNSTCAATTTLTNVPPTADAGLDYTIPISTAFVLEGSATDPDGLSSLTYNWSQNDPEEAPSTGSPQPTWTVGPLYRAKLQIISPNRYMPQLSDVIAGNLTPTWEVTPSVGRTMEFSFVVRDNDIGGPQEHDDLMMVTVDGGSGPFEVTSQGSAVTWNSGASETVTWNVAGTSIAPVSASNVDIFLSTDGGYTYPITIVSGVPNNGSATITVPTGAATTTGRIMVRGENNIFFDINNADITIVDAEFVMNFSSSTINVCPGSNAVFDFMYNTFLGFSEVTTFSDSGAPVGTTVVFNPTTAVSDSTSVQMTISGITGAMVGSYWITVTGTATSVTKQQIVTLNILDPSPGATTLTAPADGSTGIAIPTDFSWSAVSGTGILYDIFIATDTGFTSTVDSSIGQATTNYTSSVLGSAITYYWHVEAYTSCGTGGFSSTFSFTTINCNTVVSTDVPTNIPSPAPVTVTSTLSVPFTGVITDVNVLNLTGQHTRIYELTFNLISPTGTNVLLWDQICGFENDFDINLDDSAVSATLPCPPIGGGTFQPQGTLSSFNGEDPNGTWTLSVTDNVNIRGGSIDTWELEICTTPVISCTDPDVPTVTATIDTLCDGNSSVLSATGNLNDATAWQWYSISCGGTFVDSGTSITVSPSATTNYSVRGEGGCVTPGTCGDITIAVNPIYSNNETASICDGDTYTFPDGSTSTTTTTQTSVLNTVNGCDSIIITSLTVNPTSSNNATASICDGDTYTFPDGSTSTTATTNTSVLSSVNGCDSTIITTLSMDSAYSENTSASICNGNTYTFPDGSTSTTATTNTSVLTKVNGCDSTIVTTLSVDTSYSMDETAMVCEGDTYTFPDGDTSTVAITHTSNFTTTKGCDSTITTWLNVSSNNTNETASICDGATYTFPDGSTSTTATSHTSVLTGVNGCDSNITTDLTVNPTYSTNESASVCEGDTYTFPDGSTSSTATTNTSTLTSVSGCDSVVTTTLGLDSVDNSVTIDATFTLTAGAVGATYQWISCNGNVPISGAWNQSYTAIATGTYAVIVTQNGCTDTSVCTNVVITGLDQIFGSGNIKLYPNPAGDQLAVDFGINNGSVQLQLTDIRGRLILDYPEVSDNIIILSLGDLGGGIYLLRITDQAHTKVHKIVKE